MPDNTQKKVAETHLLNQINNEKDEFDNDTVTIVPGYEFNQKRTIERAYRYYNSQYANGDVDSSGNFKYFFNIVKSPVRATTKAIDFDTKDIKIQTASGGSPLITWYMERDLKHWFKERGFAKVLNRIFDELPKFGSSVIKVIAGQPYFVDLRNFIVRQDADSLDASPYIIEKHLYSVNQFKDISKKLGWENTDEVIEKHIASQTPYILVYERYGNIDGVYSRVFFADIGKDTRDTLEGEPIPHDGVELKRTLITQHPYWEFHLEKIPGRWLGLGVIEILFDTQVKMNEDTNLETSAAYLLSSVFFQTQDSGFNRNIMTESESGEVFNVDSPITQVPIDARNLAFFNQQKEKWLLNRDEITFARDVIRGQHAPASATLGAVRIATIQASGYFDQIMENVAQSIKAFLYEVVIPQFQKENKLEHTLLLVGEDLDTYNRLFVKQKSWERMIDFVGKKKRIPSFSQYQATKAALEAQIKSGTEKVIQLGRDFYKDTKYKIDIIITGEMKDNRQVAQTMLAGLQAITVDPDILVNPTKRKFLAKMMEIGGVPPADIMPDISELQKVTGTTSTAKPGGGGVSRPAQIDTGSIKSEQTI